MRVKRPLLRRCVHDRVLGRVAGGGVHVGRQSCGRTEHGGDEQGDDYKAQTGQYGQQYDIRSTHLMPDRQSSGGKNHPNAAPRPPTRLGWRWVGGQIMVAPARQSAEASAVAAETFFDGGPQPRAEIPEPTRGFAGPGALIGKELAAERAAVAVLLEGDRLVVGELAVLDEEPAELVGRDVAVLVDRVRAEDRLLALRLKDLVDDRLAVVAFVAGALHRTHQQAHRLVPVDRVRLGLPPAVLGLEVLEELLAFGRIVLGIDRADGDVRVLLRIRRQLARERGLRNAVRTEHLDPRVSSPDVLVKLDPVRRRDAAEEEGIRAAGLDLLRGSSGP